MPGTTRYRPNSPPILHETLDNETIIVNLEIGTYYSLNAAGTNVWNGFEEGASVEEVVASLADASGADRDEVDSGVRAFVDELIAAELVIPRDDARTPIELAPDWPDGLSFEAPTLNTYTDMQELLLLDPVHDVGVGGWPQRA